MTREIRHTPMSSQNAERWFDAWGYQAGAGLYSWGDELPVLHAYRNEVNELLNPDGLIRATAVYDVEGVPTVCFIEDNGSIVRDQAAINRIREKIWNQNLISIVLVVGKETALALPVCRQELEPEPLPLSEANDAGPYSQRDFQSGDVFRRHSQWFESNDRVDQDLLRNLRRMVDDLAGTGLEKLDAQYLIAQVLFVSYLECRNIIGESYRTKHQLGRLHNLVSNLDRSGLEQLITQLKCDFNGDFLESESLGASLWMSLTDEALRRIDHFLCRTDLDSGQTSLWHYDFRYIPVELISGIYESFLSDEKKEVGAYYTPRNLANLVIDRAFSGSANILEEKIYDGACGSGILLTTAYRRMLSFAETKSQRPLQFNERRKLLEEHIFGSDINESACRVTAFSLYLSLLEGIQPTDIGELQDNENIKLPTLRKKNILSGKNEGDFFSTENTHASNKQFTLLISNPPWVEPGKGQLLSSDHWAEKNKTKIPRRQTAGAFMLRARDCLTTDGRVCLILPVSIIAAPTSEQFLKLWLDQFKPETVINFGDLRKLLFSTARNPGMVITAVPRNNNCISQIPGSETFEYWVPKADISFAFGRLTLHGSDRHILQTSTLRQFPEILTTLFWGSERDVATIANLRLRGTLEKLINKNGAFPSRKGFHQHDSSIDKPVSTKPLHSMPFLDANYFNIDGPVLDKNLLTPFPKEKKNAARLPDDLMAAFHGPKIIFKDGATNTRQICAAFSNKAFSFISSIGVIAGNKKDEPLLRFIATYMHSNLAQYVLMLTAYQLNFDRERISLTDIKGLPFVHPDDHPEPEKAWHIVNTVADLTLNEERKELLSQSFNVRESNALIMEYFGLNSLQKARINEVVNIIAPNLQPSSIKGLITPLQNRPKKTQIAGFTKALYKEFDQLRMKRGGLGDINIDINVDTLSTCGPLGIICIEPSFRDDSKNHIRKNVREGKYAVSQILSLLNKDKLFPLPIQNNLNLATDVIFRQKETIFFIKPLVTRLWLSSEAYCDAQRIVQFILSSNNDKVT